MPATFRRASITAICMPKQTPKIGHLALAGELRGADHALRAPLAEAAGHQDAVDALQPRGGRAVVALEGLALDPVEIDLHLVGDAAVDQRLDQRLVGVVQHRVLADDGDGHLAVRMDQRSEISSQRVRSGAGASRNAEDVQHLGVEALA